jgi:hypothetical protein
MQYGSVGAIMAFVRFGNGFCHRETQKASPVDKNEYRQPDRIVVK